MGLLKSLHKNLNEYLPPELSKELVKAPIISAFAYIVLAIGIIFFTLTANESVVNSLSLIKYTSVLCIISAIACLQIAHYFHYEPKVKKSISRCVTTYMFMQLLLNIAMFFLLLMYIQAATEQTHKKSFKHDGQTDRMFSDTV